MPSLCFRLLSHEVSLDYLFEATNCEGCQSFVRNEFDTPGLAHAESDQSVTP